MFEDTITKDSEGKTTAQRKIASAETSPYPCYRLYRLALLQEMKKALSERNIPIIYDSKFEEIISDTTEGILFRVGGRIESAAMVIGSDGIHSALRRHITDAVPIYTGILCVYGHIPTASVQWPDKDFIKSCTVLGKQGSLFMVPEVKDKSDLMVGTQFPYPEADRKGWESLAANKDLLSTLLRKDYDQWNETMKQVIDELCKRPENILTWPFYAMPRLKSWASTSGMAIMIGDAAHAMPASSGQGVNQALEDAISLARTLSHASTMSEWPLVLSAWQAWRQEKIDRILQMAQATNLQRSSEVERVKSIGSAGNGQVSPGSLRWLHDLDLDALDRKVSEVCVREQ